jgi:hypothetical protein
MVTSMERSLAFYIDGLGFTIQIDGSRAVGALVLDVAGRCRSHASGGQRI